MGRKQTYPPLAVVMNGRLVGKLSRASGGVWHFGYDQEWLGWAHAIPVSLSLPLTDETYRGDRVLAVFDNLLPEHPALRQRLAARFGVAGSDTYVLLAEIGRDCIGALQILPEDQLNLDGMAAASKSLAGERLDDDQIAEILRNLSARPLGLDRDRDFRISVAGVQEKTALLRLNGQWFEPRGTTPTTHIIKPTIGQLAGGIDLSDSVANEYFCLKLLAELNLPSAKAEMAQFGDIRALVVERFDRVFSDDGRLIRLPQEDICQALGIAPNLKYQSDGGPTIIDIMGLLDGSNEPLSDRRAFFKCQIVFWLIAATDGHGKNFSIHLEPGGRFRLAPFYDVISIQPGLSCGQVQKKQAKMAMSWGKNRHYRVDEIAGRHIVETGILAGLSKPIIEQIIAELAGTFPNALSKLREELAGTIPDHLVSNIAGAAAKRFELFQDL